ncbi:MAG TPA: ABC transporter permease, partial [Methylophilaceae bacterium]|nr:ABC transporter permease [Methylophilaceae bacterium]
MILNIARKELKSLFASPMGWIILALLMMAFG